MKCELGITGSRVHSKQEMLHKKWSCDVIIYILTVHVYRDNATDTDFGAQFLKMAHNCS